MFGRNKTGHGRNKCVLLLFRRRVPFCGFACFCCEQKKNHSEFLRDSGPFLPIFYYSTLFQFIKSLGYSSKRLFSETHDASDSSRAPLAPSVELSSSSRTLQQITLTGSCKQEKCGLTSTPAACTPRCLERSSRASGTWTGAQCYHRAAVGDCRWSWGSRPPLAQRCSFSVVRSAPVTPRDALRRGGRATRAGWRKRARISG